MALPGSPLTLYVNADDQVLVRSVSNPAQYTVPHLYQGDSLPVEFQLLYKDLAAQTQLVIVPTTEYSLQIGIYLQSDGTQLAYQNTFTSDTANQTKIGTLSLNTSAIDTAITAAGATGYIAAYIQIRYTATDGTTRTVYKSEVRINKTYLTASSTAVPPSETAATESWVRSTFLPRAGTSGGDVKIMQSSGGTQFRFYVDDDGVPHFDRIT